MGKLNINNGGVDTNKKMADIDERFGPYSSIEAADAALGGQGRNTITAGLTVGILTANAGVKEYWYQPNKNSGVLELIPKGGNAADNPTDGNFASFDENGNVVDSDKKADDFAPIGQAVPLGETEDVGKVLEKQENGFGWVEKPVDGTTPHIDQTTKHWMIGEEDTEIDAEGKSAYQVYVASLPDDETPMTEQEWLASLKGDKGDTGNDAHNPNLGSYTDVANAPTENIQAGDYITVLDTTQSPVTGTIYTWNSTTNQWESTGRDANEARFSTGELVGFVGIDDECIRGKSTDVASAKAVSAINLKTADITYNEETTESSYESGKYLRITVTSGYGITERNGSGIRIVEIPQDCKKIRFLGVSINTANTSTTGYGFATMVDNQYVFDFNNLHPFANNPNQQELYEDYEYELDVPANCTHFVTTVYFWVSSTNILDIRNSFYIYGFIGKTLTELIKEQVDGVKFNSGELVKDVEIDDTHLNTPNPNALVIASDVAPLKLLLSDINYVEQNVQGNYVAGKYVEVQSSNHGIVDRSGGGAGIVVVEIPSGFDRIKFKGVCFQTTQVIGYGFGNIENDTVILDYDNTHKYSVDNTISNWWAENDYEIPIPEGFTHFVATVYFATNSGNLDIRDSFQAYVEHGQTVKDYVDESIEETIDSKLSDIEFTDDTFLELKDRIALGGNINIPEGEYIFTETVYVQSNTKIVGVPGKTIFKSAINAPLFDIFNKEDIYIEGVTFKGSMPSNDVLYYPTIQDIEGSEGKPITYGFVDFNADISDSVFVINSDTGKIHQVQSTGWRAMGPIAYNGGGLTIKQYFDSSQGVLVFCDNDDTVLGTKYSGEGTRYYLHVPEQNIPSGTTRIYWNVSPRAEGTPRLYMIDSQGVTTSCNEVGIHIHSNALSDGNYPKKIVLLNCLFEHFNFAGILTKNIVNNSSTSRLQNSPKFISCRFENSVNGVVLDDRSEFMTFSVCEFSYNLLGMWVKSSNTNIASTKFIRNLCFGLVSNGTGANSNHYTITDCQFAHNGKNQANQDDGTYDIVFTNSVGPLIVSGTLFGVEGIIFNKSRGIMINGCGIACPIYITANNDGYGKNIICNSSFDDRNSAVVGNTDKLSLKNNYCIYANNESNFNN